ncbi:hypothetical protein BCO18430_02556 [Burkholderia contaminans]|nr:hypothetical protein BCO18430_02556 [Burkholderia contaminans]
MRSIMRSARIALYKWKKIANRSRHCAFLGFSFDGIDRDTQARRRRARLRGSEWSLTRRSGDQENQAHACLREYRRVFNGGGLKTANARYQSGNRGKRPHSRRNRRPKTNRRPESVSNPGRRLSTTGKQATRHYRCAAALLHVMPMPRSPAPSPSSRVHCPDRCRRADHRAALPTSRPRPPRSSCRLHWWPSAPCRGTCRHP